MSTFGKRNPAAFCAMAAALVSACIVVSPLDDFPDAPAVGSGGSSANGGDGSGGSKAGGGGTSGAADAGEDGSGGTTLQGGNGGLGGSGGKSGAGASGDAGEAGNAGTDGCSTNRECVVAGGSEPYRCRSSDRTCVSLKSPDCPLVYPNEEFPDVESIYSNPNALYVGGFATIDPVRPDQSSVIWAQRLAIEELNASDGGLPTSDGERRPLVMIVCNNDTSGDPDTIDRAMQHLTEEVQVPGLVATLKPADLLRAFEDHGHDKTFFLDPVSANNEVVNYDDDDLIWTMLGPPSDYRQGYRELLELMETYLRATRISDPEQKIKVALVSTTDAFNAELKSFVEPVLSFNGVSAEANGTAQYMSVEVDIGLGLSQQNAQITELTNQIIAFRPDIVVSTAGEAFTRQGGVLQQIEFGWDNGTGGERPFYLLSPYNAGNTSPVMDVIESQMVIPVGGQAIDPNAHERFVGLSSAGAEDPTLKRGFVERLRDEFGENAITDTEHYYDSVYYLAYSMFASGRAAPSGPQIASGMRRLLGGDPFDVGPDSIADVFDALSEEDATIELIGTLGPPDFNARTGVRIGTTSVFCFSKTSTTTVALRSDVLRYDLELAEFRGEDFPCFSGFFPP